jgi:hypothetical protein
VDVLVGDVLAVMDAAGAERAHLVGPRGYPCVMATMVLDPDAPGLDELKERRRVSGLDRFDEVWEGVLHMVPAPSDDVDEVLIVDPQTRSIDWLGLEEDGGYRPIERSRLVALGAEGLAERVDWP